MLVSNYGTFRTILNHYADNLKRVAILNRGTKKKPAKTFTEGWVTFIHLPGSKDAYTLFSHKLDCEVTLKLWNDKEVPYLVAQSDKQLCNFSSPEDGCFSIKVSSMEAALKQIDLDKWQKEPFCLTECERDARCECVQAKQCLKSAVQFERITSHFTEPDSWVVRFDRIDVYKDDLAKFQNRLNDSIEVAKVQEEVKPDFEIEGLSDAVKRLQSVTSNIKSVTDTVMYLMLCTDNQFYLLDRYGNAAIPLKGIWYAQEQYIKDSFTTNALRDNEDKPLATAWGFSYTKKDEKEVLHVLNGKVTCTRSQKERNRWSDAKLVIKSDSGFVDEAKVEIWSMGWHALANMVKERFDSPIYDVRDQRHFTPEFFMPDVKAGLKVARVAALQKLEEQGFKKTVAEREGMLCATLVKSEGESFPRWATYEISAMHKKSWGTDIFPLGTFQLCFIGETFEMRLSSIPALTEYLALGDQFIRTAKGEFLRYNNLDLTQGDSKSED